ncbi:ATP-binding protein [Nocardia vinacea]|uniref:ATP-binding protein n=1 Tax=Nocardia vinacea TaxID=96468 RepID=UPI0002D6C044|nr:ATP-binding protein [Nocardia vinacea]
MSDDLVLTEMLAALERSPEVLALRVRVIELLIDRGRHADALAQCAAALGQEPGHARVLELLQQCTIALTNGMATPAAPTQPTLSQSTLSEPSLSQSTLSEPSLSQSTLSEPSLSEPSLSQSTLSEPALSQPALSQPALSEPSLSEPTLSQPAPSEPTLSEPTLSQPAPSEPTPNESAPDKAKDDSSQYDWAAAEEQVGDIIAPAFIDEGSRDFVTDSDVGVFEKPTVKLADVGGMQDVKRQLELTLLGPIRNPGFAKAFGTSARGGLLLYGPPGCGKTFIAAAVAGELGANFYPIEIADILDIYHGSGERNLHEVFEMARRNAPCVLFLDEVDALGHKRSQMSGSAWMRNVVNQLLNEMDSATHSNDGVYILGATNHPWDLDVALRRPGRFDRMILVGLPDSDARRAILHYHLKDRPVAGIDLPAIVRRTDGFSGADLAHICTSATQLAMADSISTGTVRPVGMADIEVALSQIKPSAGPWFESARNVIEFANGDGTYDELAKYMRAKKFRS